MINHEEKGNILEEFEIKLQSKGLSFFEKYLTLWVVLCIIGGIILGKKIGRASCRERV